MKQKKIKNELKMIYTGKYYASPEKIKKLNAKWGLRQNMNTGEITIYAKKDNT